VRWDDWLKVVVTYTNIMNFKTVQDEARALFEKKNADYGDAFATHGLVGILVRIQDKLQRYMSITKKSVQLVDDETLRDTLMDLHNYAAMGIMLDEPVKTNTLKVRKLTPDATIPTRGSTGAVGYDLYSSVDTCVALKNRTLVDTGIAITLPPGTYGRVAPRSGLAVKKGIQVGAGVIDPDYTGEVKVLLFNDGEGDFVIKKGERIAQLIIERCETPTIEEVDSLDDTERGEGGFGSTGQ
jgi:dUTP pyrophosphatase